jgi:hypothetical protein
LEVADALAEQAEVAALTDADIARYLGAEEMVHRMYRLSDYEKYITLAEFLGASVMTVNQSKAWSAFAATIDPHALIKGNTIVRRKSDAELNAIVLRQERSQRERIAGLRYKFAMGEELSSWDKSALDQANADRAQKLANADDLA